MTDISKYIKSETIVIPRSKVNFADYNPRVIPDEALKTLKRGIKRFGLIGGIIVNKRTGMTVVSGHQRLTVMDDLHKYDPKTKENDYQIRVDVIDVDDKAEKEINILMNNPNAQGQWDLDKLASLIPDIDYKVAGLTEADLDLIGVDYLYKTEAENNMASELDSLMQPIVEEREQQKAVRAEQRKMQAEIDAQVDAEADRAAKIAHMKDVKQQVREQAEERAKAMLAYVTISFDTYEAKAEFCQRFGYSPDERFIKGEVFGDMIERVDNEDC